MTAIREYQPQDWTELWKLLEPVFRAGETYAIDRDISEPNARRLWTEVPRITYVAENDGAIVGTYYLKSNQAGPGAHVCNCGYVVSTAARGKGIASQLCAHSQDEARRLGYRSMQFNLVVSTNEEAIRLWKKLGYDIVGRLPEAFDHPQQGLVDAFVMFKHLIHS